MRTMICPKCGAENLSWRSRCLECGEKMHPEDDKLPSVKSSNPVIFLPFIVSLLGTGALVFIVMFAYYLSSKSIPALFYGLLAVPLAGMVICWKWPRVAGVLLIITSMFPITLMLVGGAWEITEILMFPGFTTLPLLASGIFLIILSVK